MRSSPKSASSILAGGSNNRLIKTNASGLLAESGITIDASDNLSGIGTVGCGIITQSGVTLAATYHPLTTVGIAQNNLIKASAADIANGEYARFTATGLESRTAAEVAAALDHGTLTGLGDVADHLLYLDLAATRSLTGPLTITSATQSQFIIDNDAGETFTIEMQADGDTILTSEKFMRLSVASGQNFQLEAPDGNVVIRDDESNPTNLIWRTDGMGDMGASGANRPNKIYAKDTIFAGSNINVGGTLIAVPPTTATPPPNAKFVSIGGGLYSLYRFTSSARYKENISPTTMDTSKIYDLKLKQFQERATLQDYNEKKARATGYIGPYEKDRNFYTGLIAEEVYVVNPVWTIPHRDLKGNIVPGEVDSVDYQTIALCTLAELKKLKERVDLLEG